MLSTVAAGQRGDARARRLSDEAIGETAMAALCRAGRPRGSHPAVIADALGVLGLPCAPEDAPALEGATADRFRYPWLEDEGERRRRAFAGLASSILLRAGRGHRPADVAALARVLEARPDLG